jgi:DUF4097 and DUF4098 domain-containing protein YvlB
MRAKLLVIAVLTVASLAHADTWSKRYTVSGVPNLYLKTGDGNIELTPTDSNEISVRVTTEGYKLAPDAVTVQESQSGANVSVEVRVPHSLRMCIGFCYRKIEVVVSVPRHVNLDLNTSDGSIEASGVTGDFRLHTGDGHMELHSLDGSLVASSGDGHITADGRFDRLDLQSGDGHIDVEARRGSHINSPWRLRSGDGGIRLSVPDEFAADLEATTGDGSIDVDFPVTVDGGSHRNRSRLYGKMNGGGGLLEVHTGDGSIHLSRL